MVNKQLVMVARWEQEKEEKMGRDYQVTQQHVDENQLKLEGLEQYRLDYMRGMQQRASGGVSAMSFNQHQAFIDKLDVACQQQREVVKKASLVAEQRKQQWLKQQQKRRAVEMLLEKQQVEQMAKEAKIEQGIMDEFALQKFIRQGR